MEQKQQPITFTPTLGNFALLLAVVAMLMILIPIFFECWHVAFVWIHLIAALGSLSCAIAAYREDEDKKKVVIALILVFFSYVMPSGFVEEHHQANLKKVEKETKKAIRDAERYLQNYDYYGYEDYEDYDDYGW
jgi:glycerol-3-phosphate acyltransferase PlsY